MHKICPTSYSTVAWMDSTANQNTNWKNMSVMVEVVGSGIYTPHLCHHLPKDKCKRVTAVWVAVANGAIYI